MPRIYTSTSDPLDFCIDCFWDYYPSEIEAFEVFGHDGDGPDGRGNCFAHDAEHPDYGSAPYGMYRCWRCEKILQDWDN